MSPEYAMEGLFSIKSDVYSFGVLLIEIIGGKKNSSYYPGDPILNLIGHVSKCMHLYDFFPPEFSLPLPFSQTVL